MMRAYLRRRDVWSGGLGLLSALALACGDATPGGGGLDFFTESAGPGPAGSSGGTDGTTGDDVETPPGSDDTTQGADEGSGSSTGDDRPPAEPCVGVDLVVVVDNSEPMLEEQARLRGAALSFVEQVQASIPTLAADLHIGVLTTDDELFAPPAGETCPAGYEGGNRWMTTASTMLGPELECAVSPGTAGSPNERPMDMLIASLSDDNLAPGGPHNGFLREDALLVVVLVTNEEDELEADTAWGSAGEPAEWAEALADRKGGYRNNVVVLSLLGTPAPNACPDFQWDGVEGAQISPRLIEFTESFPQGAVGDICEDEYGSFLLGVVPGITAACAAYTPL